MEAVATEVGKVGGRVATAEVWTVEGMAASGVVAAGGTMAPGKAARAAATVVMMAAVTTALAKVMVVVRREMEREGMRVAVWEAMKVGKAAGVAGSAGWAALWVAAGVMASRGKTVAGSCSTLRSRHYCGHRIESCVRYRRHRSCSGCRSSRRGQR